MENLASFVINLDRSPDRMAQTSALLNGIDLPFTRIAAVDGANCNTELAQNALATMGRPLSSGEVGCFLSHRHAAEAFLASDAELGLVFEDDVDLTPHSMACLNILAQTWRNFSIWDVINLARPAKKHLTPVRPAVWDGPLPLYHAHYMPVTTTALLWTRGGARAFLMMSERLQYPVDVQIQTWVAQTDRGLAFRPCPFGARDEGSTIQTAKPGGGNPFSFKQRARLRRLGWTHKQGLKNTLYARGVLK